jgi:hypothetical protein
MGSGSCWLVSIFKKGGRVELIVKHDASLLKEAITSGSHYTREVLHISLPIFSVACVSVLPLVVWNIIDGAFALAH